MKKLLILCLLFTKFALGGEFDYQAYFEMPIASNIIDNATDQEIDVLKTRIMEMLERYATSDYPAERLRFRRLLITQLSIDRSWDNIGTTPLFNRIFTNLPFFFKTKIKDLLNILLAAPQNPDDRILILAQIITGLDMQVIIDLDNDNED